MGIIDTITSGVTWFIDFFMNKAPRPLKFILFLMLLLFFASLIPFFLQMTGIHCNTDKDVMTTGVLSFTKNYDILTSKNDILTGLFLNFTDVHPRTSPDSCYFYMKEITVGKYEECVENQTNLTGCYYYYKNAKSYNCFEEQACFSFLGFCTWYDVCKGDAIAYDSTFFDFTRSPDLPFADELNLPSLDCYIPQGYRWSWVDGYYFCYNDTICGNGTQGYAIVDEKLEQASAKRFYLDDNENSYKNLIHVKCDGNLNPILTLYGIPIFSYQLWVIGAVVFIMGYFLVKLKNNG